MCKGRIAPAMVSVYEVQPSTSAATVGHLIDVTGADVAADERIRVLQIQRVDVYPQESKWVLHVHSMPADLAGHIDAVCQSVAQKIPGVRHILVQAAVPEQPTPPPSMEATAPGEPDDVDEFDEFEDDYMETIMELVRSGGPEQVLANGPGDQAGDQVLLGSEIKQQAVKMETIDDEERSIVVEGEIFSLEIRTMRSGRRMLLFDFSDGTDSLSAKVFIEENEDVPDLKEGMWIRARGRLEHDNFTQELTLFPRDIMRIEPPNLRVDDAPEKRVELHLHTKMSALDGATDIDAVIEQAARWGHPAIAITDHGVVQAFPRAYAAGKKYGIKILYGVEGYLVNSPDRSERMYHIVLFAQNQTGLKNLYRLISESHINYFYRRPRIPRDVLQKLREGILVGSACEAGELYQAILNQQPDEELEKIASFYDYLEIQPLDNTQFHVDQGRVPSREALADINRKIVQLGRRLGKPVVATGDVHFLNPEDAIFRRIIMAGHGFTDVEQPTPLYLRTTQEMLEEFAYLGEEEARRVVIEDPRAIADSIEELRPIPSGFHPPYLEGAEEEIRRMTIETAKARYGDPIPEYIQKRIDRELNSIIGNGYASLYLIAHKLVRKSIEDGYMVGSRGSVGSSLVANLCGISEVNPLPPHYVCSDCHYLEIFDDGSVGAGPDLPPKNCETCGKPLRRDGFDIPFETFLGFEGDKVPDIDLNFSGEYQSRAHKFAETLFGAENLYRAGTISTLKERTAYGYVKKYLEDRGRAVRSAEVNRLVKGITGVRRTTGQHPGGLMVVPKGRDIHEFTPIQYPANDRDTGVTTTHFDFHTIHDQLVKLDILGHDGPTVIRMLERMTNTKATDIPLDDPKTMQIFSGLESLGISEEDAGGPVGTLGIPEYGTPFVRQMLADTRPKTFADLVRIMGLSHGTDVWLNNAQDLVRSGTVTLSETIAARDDIMIYLMRKGLEPSLAFRIMEQVRRGRGLTPDEEAAMRAHNVPEWYIESCKKISYMFPKAHAVAYAVMAFYIAYYKVHYPVAFYRTYFSIKADDCDANRFVLGAEGIRQTLQEIEKKGNDATPRERSIATVFEVAAEAVARGIHFLPVDLYTSEAREFIQVGETGLRCSYLSLSGIGASAAESIIQARKERPFTSIDDLRRRAGVSRTVIETLERHGALGDLPESDQLSLF